MPQMQPPPSHLSLLPHLPRPLSGSLPMRSMSKSLYKLLQDPNVHLSLFSMRRQGFITFFRRFQLVIIFTVSITALVDFVLHRKFDLRTWERAKLASALDHVVVATDDEKIAECCRGFGADVIMTSESCRNG
ncbi:uncharacterized protein LOC113277796 isoform X2 [Papaver somniferum]|nr:uncharacterized protein LOC113277796 isoform X2 [Papaver somniferum]